MLPSYYEGYGMAYAEAMAHGLPIIGTDAGAIPETVPAAAGILVPAGDRAALTQALDRLIGDGALRRGYAVGARAAAAGMSLQEFILAELEDNARYRRPAEVVREVRERMRIEGPEGYSLDSSWTDIRADRDRR